MRVKQSTTKLVVTGMQPGDRLMSVVSANAKIVKVSGVTADGHMKLKAGKKKGRTTLTITVGNNLRQITRTVTVSVQKNKVKTKKLKAGSKSISLNKGETYNLIPVITPITTQDKLTFTSSKKGVASVSKKGVIKAKKKGTTKITIRVGKKKATCKVKVN